MTSEQNNGTQNLVKVSLKQICTFIVFMLSLVCYSSTSMFLKLLSLITGHLSYKFSLGVTVVSETFNDDLLVVL